MAAKIIRGIAFLYAALSLFAILLIPASLFGWFGIASDPLSGVYAYLLSLPWILILMPFDEINAWIALAVSAVGMAINFWLLLRLAQLFER